jgi:hypothetical protein
MLSPFGGAGGGSICDDQTTLEPGRVRAPTVAIGTNKRPNFTVLEIAAPIQLCLWRFAEGRPIQVEVRYPDGRVAKLTGSPPGSRPCGVLCYSHVNWAAVAGDPLGDYKVTAVQRQLRAVATIRVVRSTERRSWAICAWPWRRSTAPTFEPVMPPRPARPPPCGWPPGWPTA